MQEQQSQAICGKVRADSHSTEPPPTFAHIPVRQDTASIQRRDSEFTVGANAAIPHRSVDSSAVPSESRDDSQENWTIQELSRFITIADDNVKTAIQDKDFAGAARFQQAKLRRASQILKSYGNKLHDGTEINVQHIRTALAYYLLQSGDFSSAINILRSLKLELSPSEQHSETQWNLDFDLAQAYFEASDLESAKSAVLSAKDLAIKLYSTFDYGLIQTYDLAWRVFQSIGVSFHATIYIHVLTTERMMWSQQICIGNMFFTRPSEISLKDTQSTSQH